MKATAPQRVSSPRMHGSQALARCGPGPTSSPRAPAPWVLWLACLLTAGALAGCGGGRTGGGPCPPVPRHLPPTRLVDLSHPLQQGMVVWPGGVPFTMTRLVDYDQGYRLHKFEMGENTGTHLDAPAHFVEGKRTVDQLTVEELMVDAVVIDVTAAVEQNPDYQLGTEVLDEWEATYGEIPIGSLVIARTGWYRRFSDADKYINQDDKGVMHFPGFSEAAAQLLVARDVAGIGIDTLSVDPGASKDLPAHKVMLGADKYQLENLTNLAGLPPKGARVVIGVLPVVGGTQAQARVLALMPQPAPETFSD